MEGVLMAIITTVVFVFILNVFSKSDDRKKRDALSNPNNIDDNLNMGFNLFEKKDYDGALEFFNNINRNLKMDVTARADFYKGIIYLMKNDNSQAKQAFKAFMQNEGFLKRKERSDATSTTNYLLGGIYFLEGRLEEATYHKNRAINLGYDFSLVEFDALWPEYREL